MLPNTYVDPALLWRRFVLKSYLIRSPVPQPTVDGPLTLTSYLGALDAAYSTYKTKYTKRYSADEAVNGHATNGDENKAVKVAVEAESFDYILFHS